MMVSFVLSIVAKACGSSVAQRTSQTSGLLIAMVEWDVPVASSPSVSDSTVRVFCRQPRGLQRRDMMRNTQQQASEVLNNTHRAGNRVLWFAVRRRTCARSTAHKTAHSGEETRALHIMDAVWFDAQTVETCEQAPPLQTAGRVPHRCRRPADSGSHSTCGRAHLRVHKGKSRRITVEPHALHKRGELDEVHLLHLGQ